MGRTCDVIYDITRDVTYNLSGLSCVPDTIKKKLVARRPFSREYIHSSSIAETLVFLDALLKTQHYTVRIKGKEEQSNEWSSALPYTSV